MRRFASRFLRVSAALAVAALVAAGCSNDDSPDTAASSSAAPPPSATPPPSSTPPAQTSGAASPATTGVALKFGLPGFPNALTDGNGRAVYVYSLDTGGASKCLTGLCPTNWPPVITTGAPTVDGGEQAPGTQPRPDGTVQATYGGHPLYYFIQDTAPGQLNGKGLTPPFGGKFMLIQKDGSEVS